MNIFSVSSPAPVGCTFLEWSIHWLMGHTKYLSASVGYTELSDNPLTKINAHGHKKNHPSGYKNTVAMVENLIQQSNGEWCSLYPFKLTMDVAADELGITIGESLDSDTTDRLSAKIKQDFSEMWDYLGEQGILRIHVYVPRHMDLYKVSSVRSTDRQLLKPMPYESVEHCDADFLNLFFKDSMKKYGNTLESKSDLREFMALNFREHSANSEVDSDIDLTNSHKLITAQSLWHNGDEKILEIFDYLNASIDKSRMDSWLPIYREWQRLQMRILNFVYDIDYIVNSIVNNHYFDLKPYHLDIRQEAIIQHFLIYKHGLTIKNWNLEKFPDNTKDLHALLETNFHTIPKLY